ncbi:hypothetical protein CDAR_168441 [Caerostris darwini]|uniref:Uncharacterized protein n=1 Tax=Caerostris darwini TaxID=1538125 RepID=A0AAV4T2V7_9ARAC|nr:hypothetical protein CDAR_168441 [Caerostris darwini]
MRSPPPSNTSPVVPKQQRTFIKRRHTSPRSPGATQKLMIRISEPNRYPSFVRNSSTCINCEPNNPRNKVCLSIKSVASNTKKAADVHQKAVEEARQRSP